jgi:hypothetical protein
VLVAGGRQKILKDARFEQVALEDDLA